jgi:hypothetical protein
VEENDDNNNNNNNNNHNNLENVESLDIVEAVSWLSYLGGLGSKSCPRGSVMDKIALGRCFSEQFDLPCQFQFQELQRLH